MLVQRCEYWPIVVLACFLFFFLIFLMFIYLLSHFPLPFSLLLQ